MCAGWRHGDLGDHGTVDGPGHPAVFADDRARLPRLGINLIGWDRTSWPYVY
jgi:hypothetical protein